MAKFFLLNSIKFGSTVKHAGDEVDSVADSISLIEGAGGKLVDAAATGMADAAARARELRAKGQGSAAAEVMMLASRALEGGEPAPAVAAVVVHEVFEGVQAHEVTLVDAADADAATSLTTPITYPTNIEVAFSGDWLGGDLTITGKAPDGATVSERFENAPGNTVVGVVAFASVDANGVVNSAPAGEGGGIASVQVGLAIGLCAPTGTETNVSKLLVSGVPEDVADQDGPHRTVTPTSAKGAFTFDVWFTATPPVV